MIKAFTKLLVIYRFFQFAFRFVPENVVAITEFATAVRTLEARRIERHIKTPTPPLRAVLRLSSQARPDQSPARRRRHQQSCSAP